MHRENGHYYAAMHAPAAPGVADSPQAADTLNNSFSCAVTTRPGSLIRPSATFSKNVEGKWLQLCGE